ncbi:Rieske 2Fe-2S domain-containing protein [Neisseria elongata]|uniref:Rieske 2Fe-2S domain-containing protein n=1 Tax=Neisseria elongata TaxID=495 RepID=UPI003609DBB0
MTTPPAADGLHNYWYIAATERAVRKKPQAVRLFGRHYAVFHQGGGRYAALLDCCPHRNVPLSIGKVNEKGCLQCAYHGWSFDGGGKLDSIPALCCGETPDVRVPAVHCMAQDGYVWLCIGEPAMPAPLRFSYLGEAGYTTFRMKTRFAAPVDWCLENFLDCPHAVYVHDSWFRAPTGKPVRALLRRNADGAQIEYADEPREKSLVWRLLQNSETRMSHTDRFIAPSTSQVDYRFSDGKHYIVTSSCTPRDENTTEVHTVISYKFGRLNGLIRLLFEPLSHLIIRQDVNMMQKQRDNIDRFGGRARFCNSAADLLMPEITGWRKTLAEGGEPQPEGMVREQELHL